MKGKLIAYWVTTVLFAVGFGFGAVADVTLNDFAKEAMTHLGYPLYVARMLGVFKLAGIAVMLAPGLPRLKEWAYAGFAIDLLGASVSHYSVGDGAQNIATPILFLAVAGASYVLRPAGRVMGQIMGGQGSGATSGAAAAT